MLEWLNDYIYVVIVICFVLLTVGSVMARRGNRVGFAISTVAGVIFLTLGIAGVGNHAGVEKIAEGETLVGNFLRYGLAPSSIAVLAVGALGVIVKRYWGQKDQ